MCAAERVAEPLRKTQAILWAKRLAELGARPTTIRAILPYLHESLIKDIYAEVHGERSSRGPTPYTLSAHFSSPRMRIQSTFALVTFLKYRKTGIHDIDAMIATFERLRVVFQEDDEPNLGKAHKTKGLNFDLFYALVSNYCTSHTVVLERCPGCGYVHVHDVTELLLESNCPLRKTIPNLNEQPARTERRLPVGQLDAAIERPLYVPTKPTHAERPSGSRYN